MPESEKKFNWKLTKMKICKIDVYKWGLFQKSHIWARPEKCRKIGHFQGGLAKKWVRKILSTLYGKMTELEKLYTPIAIFRRHLNFIFVIRGHKMSFKRNKNGSILDLKVMYF